MLVKLVGVIPFQPSIELRYGGFILLSELVIVLGMVVRLNE